MSKFMDIEKTRKLLNDVSEMTNEEACSILNKIYEITYVLQGTVFGLAPDYCVFGIKEINKE